MKRWLHFFALFGSLSTLLCCALPALLVALGLGATVAGMVSAVPQLVWLSERKDALFLGCALLLALAGWLRWRSRNDPCPLDPGLAAACGRARRWGGVVYWLSVGIFFLGFVVAYALPRFLG